MGQGCEVRRAHTPMTCGITQFGIAGTRRFLARINAAGALQNRRATMSGEVAAFLGSCLRAAFTVEQLVRADRGP
jgi:hypothetical protein